MIKPYPRIISFTILIIYFEKYMDGILNNLYVINVKSTAVKDMNDFDYLLPGV